MLLMCQREPYLQEATCRVLSCTADDAAGTYLVELEDSLLYPEGGGQPPDHGTIAGSDVVDVQKATPGVALCTCRSAVETGEAAVVVDWARRYDHMQQHSAQHLITAIANERLGYPTVGFHLGESYAAIELDTPTIDDEELRQLHEWVNAAIREARPIRWRVIAPEQFEAEGIRSRMLPKDHSGDLRIVEIDGIDKNTCGGTHVASTAELQMVGFLGTERIRKRVRLQFVAGHRMTQRFAAQIDREAALTRLFNKPAEEIVDAVDAQQEDVKALRYQLRQQEIELASSIAGVLSRQTGPLLHLLRPGASRQMLDDIATDVLSQRSDALVLLAATNEPSSDPDAPEGEGIFVCKGNDHGLVKSIGATVAERLQGRGGGRPGTYQGKCAEMSGWSELITTVHALIERP